MDSLSVGGNTPLFYAARTGRSKIVKLLVEKGALKNARNAKGETALLFSASGASTTPSPGSDLPDFPSTISFLLSQGLSVRDANINGLNALHCVSDLPSILSLFIQHYASSDTLKAELHEAVSQKTVLGETPLHLAALDGNFKTTQLLLEIGADPLVVNKQGKTPKQCTKDPAVLSILKHAETAASQQYLAKQDALLKELDLESSSPSSKNKPSNTKKSAKATSSAKDTKKAKEKVESSSQHNSIQSPSLSTSISTSPSTSTTALQNPSTIAPTSSSANNPSKKAAAIPAVSAAPAAVSSSSSSSSAPAPAASVHSAQHKATSAQHQATSVSQGSVPQTSPQGSWASVAMSSKKPDASTTETWSFKMERSEKSSKTAEEAAAASDGRSLSSDDDNEANAKQMAMAKAQSALNQSEGPSTNTTTTTTTAHVSAFSSSPPPGLSHYSSSSKDDEYLQDRVNALHVSAEALELKVEHLLGLHLSDLSMEQLNAIADIHRNALACIEEAKLDVVRRQERAFFEEEMERRIDVLKRLHARDQN